MTVLDRRLRVTSEPCRLSFDMSMVGVGSDIHKNTVLKTPQKSVLENWHPFHGHLNSSINCNLKILL